MTGNPKSQFETNSFRIIYNLAVEIIGTNKCSYGDYAAGLKTEQRITILSPEIVTPIID